ncbi:DNA polymerase eta [Harpegnathos saltator]|uniref:DNA polymerase eta n=1 Tax=Harpegnathos saltator TaxID=610380 RepID=E2BUE8_HARSA|nr:DNA polymerase eta [Harpegnathos saltator]XP_011145285.1 DNA polymerase eta [Harpegnathos saltator]EFN80675.1 DNA polymerase eta [Harpegnathos saltator]
MVNPGRIVVLIDMDCFFCQVETKLQPQYAGKPLAVVQYNQWEMGGIIAVNYEARNFGVTRHMRGKEAKEKCPDIVLASVPCLRGKADTTRYRKAGHEVIKVIRKHCNVIERASVDEAYLDITDIVEKRLDKISSNELISSLANTFVVGYSEIGKSDEEERHKGLQTWILDSFKELHDIQAQKLAVAGMIVEEIRASIYNETGFRCSAGISQNKILAKLACGLHKPNRQTILPEAAVASLYSTLSVKKVRNLGGKFGDVVVESLGCNVMGDLMQYSLEQLQKHFDEKTGLWLYNIARGIDNEPVTNRLLSKSVGACKKFPGKQAITSLEVLKHWAGDLAAEVCERLEQDLIENQRRATLLTISYHYYQNRSTVSQSRSLILNSYKPEKMASQCVDVITKSTQCPVAYIGIVASKFVPSKESGSFLKFFNTVKSKNDGEVSPQIDQMKITSSSGDKTNLKSNSEVVEAKSFAVINSKEDQSPKMEKKKPVTINGKEEPVRNTETTMVEKSVKTTNEATRKGNKRIIDNSLNTNMEDSPTSRRVFKLMQVCNEHDEAKLRNKRMSSMVINNNDFQSSFFMNIFKTNKKDCNENVDENSDTAEESERSEQSIVSNANNLNTSNDTDDNSNSDSWIRENGQDKPSSSCAPTLVSSNDTKNSSEKKLREESTAHNPSKLLREIFPNLDDMDPDILLLLPPDLQEEARLYARSRDKKQEKIVKVSRDLPMKTAKGKPSKTKVAGKGKRRSPILDNFLIKTDSSELLERCTECGQMISVMRYSEHIDFHVAQNLYREINKPDLSENSVKRKLEDTEIVVTSAKRQLNNNKFDGDS